MRLRTRVAAAAVALPVLLGVAACGGDQKNQATGYLPSTTVESTTAAPPKAVPQVAHLNSATFVPAMKAALSRQKSWKMTGRVTAGGRTLMTLSGVQQAKPLAMSMEMHGEALGGRQAKVIVIGKTAYLSLPDLAPAGKYVRVELGDPAAGELGSLAGSADPTKAFAAIGKAMRNAKFAGTDTIAGRTVEHYVVTVDAAVAFQVQGKPLPAGLPKTLAYHLWMDSTRIVRRMTVDYAGVSVVMTMADFNKPVTIKAPPASKIVTR